MAQKSFSDHDPKSSIDDMPNFKNLITNLYEFMIGTDKSHTIGIYGAWGSGKTSFVNGLIDLSEKKLTSSNWYLCYLCYLFCKFCKFCKRCKRYKKIAFIKIDIWTKSDIQDVELRILDSVHPWISRIFKPLFHVLLPTFFLGMIIILFIATSIPESITKNIIFFIEPYYKINSKDLTNLASVLTSFFLIKNIDINKVKLWTISIINKMKISFVKKLSRQKHYIIIDNLDRLDADEMIEALRAIKSLTESTTLNFIIPIDPEYTSIILEKHFSNRQNLDIARTYIEKIIPIPIILPQATGQYILKIFDKKFKEHELVISDETKNIVCSLLKNHRDAVRFLNLFISSYYCIKSQEKEINLDDFLSIELIKYKYYDMYIEISKNGSLLTSKRSTEIHEFLKSSIEEYIPRKKNSTFPLAPGEHVLDIPFYIYSLLSKAFMQEKGLVSIQSSIASFHKYFNMQKWNTTTKNEK